MVFLKFIQAVCVLIVHALFFFLSTVSESRNTTNCLTINSPKDIWVVSRFWMAQINLLWIFMYKFIYENIYISWTNMKEFSCFILQLSSYHAFWMTAALATNMSLPTQFHKAQWPRYNFKGIWVISIYNSMLWGTRMHGSWLFSLAEKRTRESIC